MKDPKDYKGREQTYLKHFFLEHYLERVAYVIGSSHPEFVYVDGFSGPWKSSDEAFEDTSFKIAINKLCRVREGLAKAGKSGRIRCLFIEKELSAFRALENAIGGVSEIEVKPLHGEFEQLIPDILRFIGRSFALVFIDPTGWKGFGLRRIAPILRHRPGEVLINFMIDYVNRFLEDDREGLAQSFDELFGGPGWGSIVEFGAQRERSIVELYCERMRAAGSFDFVTSTRILKPTVDRSYFYLVYGTRHTKGLQEFRAIERKFVAEQERIRSVAKQAQRIERTSQHELFAAEALSGPPSFEEEREANLLLAESNLRLLIERRHRATSEEVLGQLLQIPLVWESDVKRIVKAMRDAGEV